MYNPDELKERYENLEHGKSRIAGIRDAIREADKHNDLPFQVYFRMQLCHESNFYDDSMDMMIVFPEALALVDKHPDIPATHYNDDVYKDGIDQILWVYKWILGACIDYPQIPLEDCMNFFEDFKKRCLAYGYNLKPYYSNLAWLYKYIDVDKQEQYLKEFAKLPRDGNADCAACDRNAEIDAYLKKGDLKTAERLARDIENFTLTCGDRISAWLRMKGYFMVYYMDQKDFETAERYCRLIERNLNGETEFEKWDDFLYCYTHTNMGKALKIYKEHWKDWIKERCPNDSFDHDCSCWVFFRELAKERKRKTIKLNLDSTFPLYREDDTYVIEELADFYYKRSLDTALKFDKRNGSDWFQRELERVGS